MKGFFNISASLCLAACLFIVGGCKKLVDVPPPSTALAASDVFNNDQTAIASLQGIYVSTMFNDITSGGGILEMSYYPELSADELTLWSGNVDPNKAAYYLNNLNNQNTSTTDFWQGIYPMIYMCNASISGLNGSTGLTPAVKQQLLGEAEFMRAFFYFYLVNLYGDVPLILGTQYTENSLVSRTPQADVWNQIITDLKSAAGLLSNQYLDGTLLNSTNARVRPTRWAASALLARSYLYMGQWANAILEADTVIANSTQFQLDSLDQVFLTTSTEAIWQLQPVASGFNTPDAQVFVIPSTGFANDWVVYLSNNLMNSFEPGDERRAHWVDSIQLSGVTYYYPYKYKVNLYNSSAPLSEYEMVLRLAEQFLIRAEAEVENNDLPDAAADVNAVRKRAGLPQLSNAITQDKDSLLAAIQHERQIELFTEWGHRWLDLKRTNTLNSLMGSPGNVYLEKTGHTGWNPDWALYPVPIGQLKTDPDLTQNPGY